MKIILNRDVPNLGEEGDVCVVKDGYARNYLIPTGAAVLYSKTSVAVFKSRAAAIEKRKEVKRTESASLKEKLDNLTLELVVSAGDTGKLFGSVTSSMIQDAIAKQGIEIEKKRIEVATHAIKDVGNYTVRVHLYENEFSIVKIVIKSEAEVKKAEAEAAKAKAAEEKKAAEEAKKAADAAAKAAAAEAAAAAPAPAAEEAAPAAEESAPAEEAPAAPAEEEK
ncbi:MAG: 50S ribosomal protein L9 [Sphaerochaetaceae bacterium]